MDKIIFFSLICLAMGLCACKIGPNYVAPKVTIPPYYKEAKLPSGWKLATPSDDIDRGSWWCIFNDPVLDSLETQLNMGNQNVAAAQSQYLQSLAQVAETRSAAYPVISSLLSFERQKPPESAFNDTSGTGTATTTPNTPTGNAIAKQATKPFNTYILSFNVSWEPDLWGGLRRALESSADSAQAAAALVASVRLSSQALLAQYYFQLRTLDNLQIVLNKNVAAQAKLLKITQARYRVGVASLADVAQAQAAWEAARALAVDNGVDRALFEHAIAVLIGNPPALFSIKPEPVHFKPPIIPAQLPCELLERRPDVAQAERTVAAANAQIGVALAAFFPTIPLSTSFGFQTNRLHEWFSSPSFFWTLMMQAMETIFDGGLRAARLAETKYAYQQTVDNYRQVLLTAFQNVEDNLSTQRILRREAGVQQQAVTTARLALRLTKANYQAGTNDLTSVLISLGSVYTAEANWTTIRGRQMTAAVNLITALGGGWNVHDALSLPPTP